MEALMNRCRGRFLAAAAVASLIVGTAPSRAEAFTWRMQLEWGVQEFKILDAPVWLNDYCCIAYVLGTDTKLWREDYGQGVPGTDDRTFVDSAAIDFQPYDGHLVYVLGSDRKLWREYGDWTNRRYVDADVQDFDALDDTWVLVRGMDNKLWLENGDLSNRTLVDPAAGKFQAIDGVIYVLHADGVLWRLQGSSWSSSEVDTSVAAFAGVDRNGVYVLGNDGNLWNETGSWKSRFLVDQTVQSFAPNGGTGDLLVLGTDGNLWQELGTWNTRALVDSSVLIDPANPHAPTFAWEPNVSSYPNVFVTGSNRITWFEEPGPIGGGGGPGTMGNGPGGPSGIGNGGMGPAPACYDCYANCGNGCYSEGHYCDVAQAYLQAPGCGVCCGDASLCFSSATCLQP
jgi:hypothetical protein